MNDLQRLDFHNNQISTCRDEQTGKVYCLPREIAGQIGMNWSGQFTKLTKSALYQRHTRCLDIQTPGGIQDVLMLDIDYLPTWLASISPEKVPENIRDTLVAYQDECAKALRDYWTTGIAINPRAADTDAVLDGDMLVQMAMGYRDQQRQLVAMQAEQCSQREALIASQAQTIEALTTSQQAKANTEIILDRYRMSIEQFVGANGLLHQIPKETWQEAARWLGRECMQNGWDFPSLPVQGRPWPTEHFYPVEALMRYVEYLRRRPRQIALVPRTGGTL